MFVFVRHLSSEKVQNAPKHAQLRHLWQRCILPPVSGGTVAHLSERGEGGGKRDSGERRTSIQVAAAVAWLLLRPFLLFPPPSLFSLSPHFFFSSGQGCQAELISKPNEAQMRPHSTRRYSQRNQHVRQGFSGQKNCLDKTWQPCSPPLFFFFQARVQM